jgi:hypothetical protein
LAAGDVWPVRCVTFAAFVRAVSSQPAEVNVTMPLAWPKGRSTTSAGCTFQAWLMCSCKISSLRFTMYLQSLLLAHDSPSAGNPLPPKPLRPATSASSQGRAMLEETIDHDGYRLNLFRDGLGWHVFIYAPGGNVPLCEVPVQEDRDRVISEAREVVRRHKTDSPPLCTTTTRRAMGMRSSPPSYTVVPRRRGYWLEVTDRFGLRRAIERFDTEEEAVQRLHDLQGGQKPIFVRPGQPK